MAGDVAVIGAGAMGTGIAQLAAQNGHPVHLVDLAPGAARAAVDRLGQTFDRLVAKGKFAPDRARAAVANLNVTTCIAALPPCILVVEAIAEEMSAKRAVFVELSRHQPTNTLLASNTSSLSITQIASRLKYRERVLGLHFFNPPPLMPLVEVVRGRSTDPAAVDAASDIVRSWGKAPVQCASTPGFIVNRVARPFYGEAQRMVAAGIADPATIDLALTTHGGFRMGPMTLTDLIGQDVNLAVGTSIWEQTGHDPRYEPTAYQRDLVAAGRLGRKSGRGVFSYGPDGAPTDARPDPELARALVGGPIERDPVARTLAMIVNEAVEVVRRREAGAGDVDLAMRLGTSYPLGPIEWGQQIGMETVRERLVELDRLFPGGRYRPSSTLSGGMW